MLRPYDRVQFRGVTVNRRTKRMLRKAEKRADVGPFPMAQGSYNGGRVSASAGTHDGGGVVDIGLAGMSRSYRVKVVHALKDVGFAAWVRRPPTFDWHIHAVAFGDKEVSPEARSQRIQFDARLNGLANWAGDDTYRPKPKKGFSFILNKPKVRK